MKTITYSLTFHNTHSMMRSLLLTAVMAISFSVSLSAQNHVGTWTWTGQDQEGNDMPVAMIIKADNTYQIDFGADGNPELHGKYTYENNTMTIADEVGDCKGAKGVYKFVVDGDTVTASIVSDECPPRAQGSASMKLTRKN